MAVKQKKLIIWGAGGHAAVVADIIQQTGTYEVAAFVDDTGRTPRERPVPGARMVATRKELSGWLRAGARHMIIGVGDCAARLRLAAAARAMGFQLVSAVHPRATVAASVSIGAGTVIAAGAVVNPGAVLGENVIVNTCASVDHHCVVAAGVHICPGAHLAGRVAVGRGAWIGIGATVIDELRIGKGAFIAAGAVVVENVPENALVRGVPAKLIKTLRPPRADG